MRFLLPLLALGVAAYHLYTRQRPTASRVVAYLLVVAGLAALLAGLQVAVTEHSLGRYGQVVAGTLRERASTTGELGTPTFGRKLPAALFTSDGNAFYELLERFIATGSADAWAVNYSYPCGGAARCDGRALVPHARWLQMRAGDTVNVRYAPGIAGRARLEDDPAWATAIARMAIATSLFAFAFLFWGTTQSASLPDPLAISAWEHDLEPSAAFGRILAVELEEEERT